MPPVDGRDWAGERRWIEGLIDAKIAGLVEPIGAVIAGERARHRAELEALQARIALLEARLNVAEMFTAKLAAEAALEEAGKKPPRSRKRAASPAVRLIA